MDNDYYNDQIKQYEEKSEDITKLLKQLFVVKSSLGGTNNTLTDMECNEEKVKIELQLKSYLESVTAENDENLNILTANVTVEGHIAREGEATKLQCQCYEGNIATTDCISKVEMGALMQSMPPFPHVTTSPFPLSKNSLHLIYSL